MATRTRKQYLNDLAENHVTAINIEQANTSGRVGTVEVHVQCVDCTLGYTHNCYMCCILAKKGPWAVHLTLG